MTREEIIEGLMEIRDRFGAFPNYRKTTEACMKLLEDEATVKQEDQAQRQLELSCDTAFSMGFADTLGRIRQFIEKNKDISIDEVYNEVLKLWNNRDKKQKTTEEIYSEAIKVWEQIKNDEQC